MHVSRAPDSTPPVDLRIALLAGRQHGVVSRAQLAALGLGRGSIAHRVKTGRLHRVHPCVYAVGHSVLTLHGRFMAATLACGEGTLLSHRSAAELHGLLASRAARIDVSAPGRRVPSRALTVHTTRTLAARDVTTVERIPLTSVARTLLDLADVVAPRNVERALQQAEILRAFDLSALDDILARANGRRGTGILRRALELHRGGTTATRSGLEEAFLALVDGAGLPRPRINARILGYEVDAHWPRHGVVVELDSFKFHRTRRAFEADRRRDIVLQAAGMRIARFTDRRIEQEPEAVMKDLHGLVDSGASRSS